MKIDPEKPVILEVSGSKTFKEYVEANRVWHFNSTHRRKINYLVCHRFSYVIGGVCIAAALLLVGNLATRFGHSDLVVHGGNFNFFLLVGIGVYFFYLPIAHHRRLRKIYEQAGPHRECTTRFDEDGLSSARQDGTAESRINWGAIQYWRESSGLFVLFLSKVQYFWVSKHLLKPGDEQQLRELLTANIFAEKDRIAAGKIRPSAE